MSDDELYGTLDSSEIVWRDRQPFLESKGYMLRPRFRPGWEPSWRSTGKHPAESEDGILLPARPLLIDATRISDNLLVYIKQCVTGDLETEIATRLNAPNLRQDGRNHACPIIDVFSDVHDSKVCYMVMPFLRPINKPPFETVGEVVDCITQLLELCYASSLYSHLCRDCSEKNILMDGRRMFPEGFHPIYNSFLPDGFMVVTNSLSRTKAGVQYYYVDFGISSYLPKNAPSRLVTGDAGRERAPELSISTPYDPFKVDVYTIGHVFKRQFVDLFTNVDFLKPLIEGMIPTEPGRRSSAADALAQWALIQQRLGRFRLSRRLKPRAEGAIIGTVRDTVDWARAVGSFIGRTILLV
ncbi:hypothetical protein K488DRAFT_58252 [Vararia minispora EC-137]|uniref:Uncharacterized protein n=1 Tax=Vararia minispora EC-137 TaxID=1314806 RepID=A0ACB8QA12_9AGAM|nr:hypothetical protein K488DRAFT_58252 [Vararia minispora EC-137]